MATHFTLSQAANYLKTGAIVAYPTEAVIGLGCDPYNLEAVGRLLTLKQRAVKQGLILISDTIERIEPLLASLPATQRKRVEKSWPGPTTWLLPVEDEIPWWITGGKETVAIRVTAHPTAAALVKAFDGLLVSTSCNVHGRQPAKTVLAARRMFGQQVDIYLHGEKATQEKPTTIIDARTGEAIRQG